MQASGVRHNVMAIRISELIATSPYLYHVTHASSLGRIRAVRRLDSAAKLMEAGGRLDLLRQRREQMEEFFVNGDMIRLTDQKPIVEANIAFLDGWNLGDLIEAINRRAFFWRGPASGLLKKDQGHFAKYHAAGHQLVFVRIMLDETVRLNADRGPELCRYNSGAARMNRGKRIPRGLSTFVEPENAAFDIGNVREVVFREFVAIPSSAEFSEESWMGPWRSLWGNGDNAEVEERRQ